MTTLTASPIQVDNIEIIETEAEAPVPAPASTAVTLELIVTIAKFRPEALKNITGTLRNEYGFGKFHTWPDGIESSTVLEFPEMSHLPWTVESLVDHIRNLNAFPDPDRRIYCKITIQVFRPGQEVPLQEFRY